MITSDEIDFGPQSSTAVISSAQKFILPVPAFADGGEPLVYPEGDKAGQPVVDREGREAGGRGIVFHNDEDGAWQVAKGDGSAVIVINQVTRDQAAELEALIATLAPSPEQLSLAQLKEVLAFAHDQLSLPAIYDASRDFVARHMSKVNGKGHAPYGLHKRDARDICQAVYLPGKGEFQGPAVTPQRFTNGAVILKQGNDVRLIQPEVFEATYTYPDGRGLRVSELKRRGKEEPAGSRRSK